MEPILIQFGIALAARLTGDAVKAGVTNAFEYLRGTRPDLEERAKAAQASGNLSEIQKIFEEATGVIVADAGAGSISIDGAALDAIKGIKFDHQHGTIQIANATVKASLLVTGGGAGATGRTDIGGNTILKSQGTQIDIGNGAGIVMTGGARIIQN